MLVRLLPDRSPLHADLPTLPTRAGHTSRSGAPGWLPPLLVCAAVWALVGAALSAALYGASLRSNAPRDWATVLYLGLAPFLPLFVFSFAMAATVRWQRNWWNSPRRILRSALLCVLVMMPAFVCWEALLDAWKTGDPLPPLTTMLFGKGPVFLWMDFTIVLAAVIGQFGVASWNSYQAKQRESVDLARVNSELRLAVLQGQLEPHFLFNALNTISALVRTDERDAALSALSRVSELLRFSLRASQEEQLNVEDELTFLRHYTGLQQLRFAERLNIHWEVSEEEWEAIPFPPLLSQPLVENAIKFGMAGHHGSCEVRITLCLKDGLLVLRVANTLGGEPTEDHGHGVGLKSVRDRIALLFGEQGHLDMQQDARHFVATLSLPQEACA